MSDKKTSEKKTEPAEWTVPAEVKTFFKKYEKFVEELKDKYATLIAIMNKFDKIDEILTPMQLAIHIISIESKTECIDRLTDIINDLEEKKGEMEENMSVEYIPLAMETILRDCNYQEDDAEGAEDEAKDDTIKNADKQAEKKKEGDKS